MRANRELLCSFCDKPRQNGETFVQNLKETVFICTKCVALCNEIIDAEKTVQSIPLCAELMPPQKFVQHCLDPHVIGQVSAKMTLAVAVYNHQKRVRYQKDCGEVKLTSSNILLVGPTGSGKTCLAQTIARTLNVPLVTVNATEFTEAGYIGGKVEDIVRKLLLQCDYDVAKAQRGIVFIDEIDKIAKTTEGRADSRDVSGEGVQNALLNIIGGTVVSLPAKVGKNVVGGEVIAVNTSDILFICAGAFVGLAKLVQHRTKKSSMGFGASVFSKDDQLTTKKFLSGVTQEDLISFGMIPELLGRLPVIAVLEELDEVALTRILIEPKDSIIQQYAVLFGMENVQLNVGEDALRAWAQQAIATKTGARGLRTVVDRTFLDIQYRLPTLNSGGEVESVLITRDAVLGLEEPIVVYKQALARAM